MNSVIESFPITFVFIFITVLILTFIEIGFRFGMQAHSKKDVEAPSHVGTIVAGLLGMLAFLLAFTFNMAASQYEKRKTNVVIEANNIGTAYLRTDLVDEKKGNEIKHLLREYVNLRLDVVDQKIDLETGLKRSNEIHSLLWQHTSSVALANPSVNTSLLVQSINEVIDQHEVRVINALYNRIPDRIWLSLLFITFFTMVAMGIQMGLTRKRRLVVTVPLSVSFAILVTLIIDLNRPQQGLIKVGQQSMINVKNSMK
jgi:hypothetical protein